MDAAADEPVRQAFGGVTTVPEVHLDSTGFEGDRKARYVLFRALQDVCKADAPST